MILFIIGCVLAGLVIIGFPCLCVYLLKRSDHKLKVMTPKVYLFMFSLLMMGIASIVLIFVGNS